MSNDHKPRQETGSDTGDMHDIAAGFSAHIHNSSACPQGYPSAGISDAIGQVYTLSQAWKTSLTIAKISAPPVMCPTELDEDTRMGDSIHGAVSILLLEFRALTSAVIW